MPFFSIARNAFLESIRQPVHAVLICAALLALVLNVNVAAYTLEDDNKLLVDLGLSTLFLTGLLLAAFTATSSLSREIENKTVVTVVSKPVSRWTVVVGKFVGVTAAIASAYWLLAVAFLITVRHRVQTTVRVEDTYDGPVLSFGILAVVLTFVIAGLANYLYRRPFGSSFPMSGDTEARCAAMASRLGIDEYHAGQSPEDKMHRITELDRKAPTAMVGDGINDAPALARATIGISLSDASGIALQNAQVVLMNQGLKKLPMAMGLGRHTYSTIRQNLFWAFIYNIVAIPVAAFGLLTPAFGALVMGLSDVVLAANSVRLFVKKVA